MKTIGVDLDWELGRSLARLATCMRLTRRDGSVYGFTTNSKAMEIDGLLYEPAFSINPSDIASGSDLDTDDLQTDGILDSETITEDDIRAGRWDYAGFQLFQVNWADLSQGKKKDRSGHLGKVTVNRATFIAELLGEMETYAIGIGQKTQPACRTSLGSTLCGVTPVEVTGTIDTADTDFFTLHDSDRTEPDVYFDEGIITIHFPTGDLSYEVKGYIVGLWVTKTAIAYDATGVAYTMTQGCVRSLTACQSFDNVANFRGEPWLRGIDALVQVGRHQ